jgi:hypothetical protein
MLSSEMRNIDASLPEKSKERGICHVAGADGLSGQETGTIVLGKFT